jgi:predicted dehydrogenase
MQTSNLRVGIVGAGIIFHTHARAWRECGVAIQAVADVDAGRAQAAAARYGIPVVTREWRDLVGHAELDVIDVCTPPQFHLPVVLGALEAGKHVICEKPLVPTLVEADRVCEAVSATTAKLAIVHQLRYDVEHQCMKWLVENDVLGKICLARVLRYDAPPPELVRKRVWGDWQGAGGGVVMTKAIHQLDLLLWLLGDAKRVEAMMGTYLYPIESEDTAVVNIEFEAGALASACLSGHGHGNRQELELVGENGTVASPWRLRLKDAGAQRRVEAELQRRFSLPSALQNKLADFFLTRRVMRWLKPQISGHVPFLRAFLAALDGRGPLPVSAAEARKSIELCTAIYTSALTHEHVVLPLDSSTRFYHGVPRDEYAAAR